MTYLLYTNFKPHEIIYFETELVSNSLYYIYSPTMTNYMFREQKKNTSNIGEVKNVILLYFKSSQFDQVYKQ